VEFEDEFVGIDVELEEMKKKLNNQSQSNILRKIACSGSRVGVNYPGVFFP
jgi:hypothetical protein